MLRDTTALTGRLMKQILRSPDTIITVAITPLALFLLFRYVFGGAIQAPGNYTNYLLPGILLITVASGVAYTALRLFNDRQKGINARFLTMPIGRSAVLWSHVLTSLVSNLVTAAIIVAVGFAIGFRPQASVLGWLGFVGVLVLFTLTLTWLAVIPGLTASTAEGASAFSYPLIFLPFLSSAFVPTETMPGPVRWFAENQPVTPVVESMRALVEGRPVGTNLWIALAWLIALGTLAYAVATHRYAKASR
ncbi:ABC-2 type transporter [Xylanimonas cellulosilytica DSM 15894]|uniref:Transport permease protein n=1 Tax=Xylanimonas cellulosilytica (strain DSM 15894 / JCM 12276 / CECT 5975 / KCTC 9989 / LMG 20990 / NBRC 107835 / XIL07) TaxID=446471 RepID=D1C005_XYLCX|nr:ABC transporter permease [Xylanimonas cellulosilytica]ACZ32133.1 ABC-2 type transporter [Xylanimonas cellulosilytica DSM 15894]